MTTATFLMGIVLALAAGAALAGWWSRVRSPKADPAQPVAEALARLEAQLRESDLQRQHALGGLEHHLTSLSKETVALSQALRAPNARGRWGELTLRRVAELAGMVAFCDFTEQESGGGMRPDMIVRLPGGRTLAVDAKAPLSGYLDAEAAADDVSRRAALDRHAQQVSRHVTQLSGREYWSLLQPAPEMVVLFLPGDHFLGAALERDPELLERALAKKVLLATPLTLVSVLKGIAYGWRQERLAKNADELRRISSEFYERVRAFAEFYAASGRHLAKAVDSYNRSVASWDSRLQPSLKRMRELGVAGRTEAPALGHIEVPVRSRAACLAVDNVTALMRDFFLYLSRQRAIRKWMETSAAARKLTQRFVAGESLEQELSVCTRLRSENILSTLDHLGENVTSLEEAAASRDAYLAALDQLAVRNIQATISLKLTQMGLDFSEDACLDNVRALARKADEAGTRLEIDMESTAYTDRTLHIVERVAGDCGCVRAVIQAYLSVAKPTSSA